MKRSALNLTSLRLPFAVSFGVIFRSFTTKCLSPRLSPFYVPRRACACWRQGESNGGGVGIT